ncbi:MAG: PDZ domain-containing protein [Erysipelotrichia bacterium]|nr:PDZ domain-containing protein [Erysipelotrichia bacterium]
MNLIQTNAAINSGNSGGGLFNGQGDLIGIVNAKDSGTTSTGATIEGLGFAIPINDAMDIAEQLMSDGYVTDRATLGVYVTTLTADQGNYKAGVYITELIDGGGAANAGLKVYDRIIAVDSTSISTYQELSKILKNHEIGDTVTLTIVRDSTQMDVQVKLTAPISNNSSNTSTPAPEQIG